MKVVGKQVVDYISKKTQEPVKGLSLHCVGNRNGVEGQAVETIFVSAKATELHKVAASLPINSEVDFSYNRWGGVIDIRVAK